MVNAGARRESIAVRNGQTCATTGSYDRHSAQRFTRRSSRAGVRDRPTRADGWVESEKGAGLVSGSGDHHTARPDPGPTGGPGNGGGPAGPRRLDRFNPRAGDDHAARLLDRRGEGEHQLVHAAAEPGHRGAGGAGVATDRACGRRERGVAAQGLLRAGRQVVDGEQSGIGGVHATDDRLNQAVQHAAAHPALHQFAQRGGGSADGRRCRPVEQRPGRPPPADHPPDVRCTGVAGYPEPATGRQRGGAVRVAHPGG